MDRDLRDSYLSGVDDAAWNDDPGSAPLFESVEFARRNELLAEGYPLEYAKAHAKAYAQGWFAGVDHD